MKSKAFVRIVSCIVLIFLFASFSSSPKKALASSSYLCNGLPLDWITYGEDFIYDKTKNPVKMLNVSTNKEYDFIRDPFFKYNENFDPVGYVFAGQNCLYYLIREDFSSFEIIRRDYQTFAEKSVFKKTYHKMRTEIFLGAANSIQPDFESLYNTPTPFRFCVFDENLFLFYANQIEKINLKTKKQTVLCKKGLYNGNYSYYDGKIYFISSDYSLYSYQILKDKLEKVEGVKAQNLLITPEKIFYSNANDNGKLYSFDFDYKNKVKLSDISVSEMDFFDNHLYFLSEGKEDIYSISLDGKNSTVLLSVPKAFSISCIKDTGELFILYTNSDGNFDIYKHCI
ncbi:MAG TPA: DUF5050 domain-containing protein [Oscillospiraceae bacterium]|nr:DUF5050 domain-containing protein [Oscillospiraceae bacterium]